MLKIRFSLLLIILTLVAEIVAQSNNATIRGNVWDERATLLPGVKITATNAKTKETFTATSNESGAYRFAVPAGIYEINAELPGFSSVKVSDVTVKENELKAVATLTLKAGNHPVDIHHDVIPIPPAPLPVQPSNRI